MSADVLLTMEHVLHGTKRIYKQISSDAKCKASND